jgi:hypothetical protein
MQLATSEAKYIIPFATQEGGVPQRSQVQLTQAPPKPGGPPVDDETAEREIDAIIARLDVGLAREFEVARPEPGDLMDRITGSFRRVFGIGQPRKTQPPADDEAAEQEIDATIARVAAGIAQARREMEELLPKLRSA